MSTDVETAESAPETSAAPPVNPAAGTQPPLWLRRRYQLAAVVTLIAIVAAVTANNFLARQYTADGAVRQYLSGLQAGDAATSWSQIQVSAPTVPVAATLTDRAALQAALGAGKPDLKSFAITSTTSRDPSTTIVDLSYDTSSGIKQAKFVAQRSGETHFGFYPVWRLVIAPTVLSFTLPRGNAGVTIDGKGIALPDGKSSVAVLPLVHKVQFNGTQILGAQTVSVDTFFSSGQSIGYKPQLTTAGTDKAKVAIKAAFTTCAQASDASVGRGCPQDAGLRQQVSGQWQLIGDPTQDLTVGLDQNANIAALGHYQMVFTYGAQHLPSAGGYVAALVLSPTDVAVGAIDNTHDAIGLQRPAGATDQAIKGLVNQGFARCAKSTTAATSDCPQEIVDYEPHNISWSMSGDPLAGATISFDSNTGLITVRGSDTMTASYVTAGSAKSDSSFTRSYVAYLLWDGQGLQLVTILGVI
jgi:hypothetical protein